MPSSSWQYTPPVVQWHSTRARGELNADQPHLGLRNLHLAGRDMPGHLLGVDWRPADEDSSVASGDARAGLTDAYVRGDDFVASYVQARDQIQTLRAVVYWRNRPGIADALSAMSLIVSIDTQLLDARPRLQISTTLPATEVLHIGADGEQSLALDKETVLEAAHTNGNAGADGGDLNGPTEAGCLLYRLPGGATSCAVMAHPSDFEQVNVGPADPKLQHRDEQEAPLAAARWQLFGSFLEKGVIRRARMHLELLPRENDVALARAALACFTHTAAPLTA